MVAFLFGSGSSSPYSSFCIHDSSWAWKPPRVVFWWSESARGAWGSRGQAAVIMLHSLSWVRALVSGGDRKGCVAEVKLSVQKPSWWIRLVTSVQVPFEHLFSISLGFKGFKAIHMTKIKLLVPCLCWILLCTPADKYLTPLAGEVIPPCLICHKRFVFENKRVFLILFFITVNLSKRSSWSRALYPEGKEEKMLFCWETQLNNLN